MSVTASPQTKKSYAKGLMLACYPEERAVIFDAMKAHELKTPFDAIRLAFIKAKMDPKKKLLAPRKRE